MTSTGSLYIAEKLACRIRLVVPSGLISTVAGSTCGSTTDPGPATSAMLAGPTSVTVDRNGTVYFVDYDNNRIRYVKGGTIYRLIGNSGTKSSTGDGLLVTANNANVRIFFHHCFITNILSYVLFAGQFALGRVGRQRLQHLLDRDGRSPSAQGDRLNKTFVNNCRGFRRLFYGSIYRPRG
jgi:hypothetical protein